MGSLKNIPGLDEMVGIKFPILDDGFIRLVDYMGSDSSIVQAARVSYGKGTKKLSEDRGLIRYLMRNSHSTPFEMCEIKLHIRVSMDTWRQWIRHRTANVNEYSTRYSLAIDSISKTSKDKWRLQNKGNKQGSGDYIEPEIGAKLSEEEKELHEFGKKVYANRINHNIAREQARKDIPLSTYTEAYWKIDLHNLFHFLRLRMDSHAQFEIREYANFIGNNIVSKWCPLAWEAFCDYKLETISLSKHEISIIHGLMTKNLDNVFKIAIDLKFINSNKEPLKNRERIEFEKKTKQLGIALPW